eukprot:5524938-Amphidinium_carterae.1
MEDTSSAAGAADGSSVAASNQANGLALEPVAAQTKDVAPIDDAADARVIKFFGEFGGLPYQAFHNSRGGDCW